MKTLCIDTSSATSVVALVEDGRLLAGLSALVTTRHEDTLLPHVESLLVSAGATIGEVDRLAIGLGPGGFTSLRVGIASTKGLAIATGKPLVGVGSLRVLARGLAGADGLAAAVVDAHRGEVYAALYRFAGDRGEELLAPLHGLPEAVGLALREAAAGLPLIVGGDGLVAHGEALARSLGEKAWIAPSALFAPSPLALAIEAEEAFRREGPADLATLEPLYVRPSDAKLPDRPLLLAR
ncbi:MAG: tRNA (adenosine(37)-N6)-threonylcarbamoyltransferase complex dimerization subunit type 1 TsaB [Polyangiales bacterium]